MNKRDRLTLTRMQIAARVVASLNKVQTSDWARQEPSREMKQIIRTAFGK